MGQMVRYDTIIIGTQLPIANNSGLHEPNGGAFLFAVGRNGAWSTCLRRSVDDWWV